MGGIAQEIQVLGNAYRATMSAGDKAFAQQQHERKILQALVASSAAAVATWTHTRVQDGGYAAKPLTELAAVLDEGNIVGRTLQAAQDRLLKQAKAMAYAAAFGTAMPLWVVSVAGVLGGLFTRVQAAGTLVGLAIAAPIIRIRRAVVGGPHRLASGTSSGRSHPRRDWFALEQHGQHR